MKNSTKLMVAWGGFILYWSLKMGHCQLLKCEEMLYPPPKGKNNWLRIIEYYIKILKWKNPAGKNI